MSLSIDDASNLAALYFGTKDQDQATFYRQEALAVVEVKKTANSVDTQSRGRGIVAKCDLEAGTCLFITPPTVSVPVDTVMGEWKESKQTERNVDSACVLEALAEERLIHEMRNAIKEASQAGSKPALGVANSFLALVGAPSKDEKENPTMLVPTINRLLGKDENSPLPSRQVEMTGNINTALREIIRRNAFGPDFVTYSAIVRNAASSDYQPHRMLGIYPLAAMLNHSCQPNAQRVFVGECMVVHTCCKIASGEEILLSYVPPTYPYLQRQAILSKNHGFECNCTRCQIEGAFWKAPPARLKSLLRWQGQQRDEEGLLLDPKREQKQFHRVAESINFLENKMLPSTKPNELQRYIRLGFTELYLTYLNMALSSKAVSDDELLRVCMQMHFGFVSCDNASTGHLSILHLCYELIGKIHTQSSDKSKTLPKLRFWTEQVKQACMVRYGKMGEDLEAVRRIMHHTRLVLRTSDGMIRANHQFI